ncbi:uncharacterized protein NEMAJ01_1095 [Nematocida major]|uniref:uncharacterized protein n=1 Tax=Nematocida major TaxID=1912982 RepID=UPI002008C9FC|nr:uncharacterized protein NEMAJ01_1095 [Nematocida major]KAH9386199.1 hypothetical protein NEMAJ01_1095 [Nematocida major]
MKSSEPAVTTAHKEASEAPCINRTISIGLVYNYVEKLITVEGTENILAEIKRKAHEAFGLSCVRLEIGKKPITSVDQIFSQIPPMISVIGIKNKCHIEKCKNRVNTASEMKCKFCTKSFCIKHSIPEGHSCENISECKQNAAEENLKKLLSSGKNWR